MQYSVCTLSSWFISTLGAGWHICAAMPDTEASVQLIMECIRMRCGARGTHPLSTLENG